MHDDRIRHIRDSMFHRLSENDWRNNNREYMGEALGEVERLKNIVDSMENTIIRLTHDPFYVKESSLMLISGAEAAREDMVIKHDNVCKLNDALTKEVMRCGSSLLG